MSRQIPPNPSDRREIRDRVPGESPVVYSSWQDLCFLHWAVEPERLRDSLPEGLRLDLYQGRAYLGIIPFFMEGVHPRYLPPAPGFSRFMELNVRTYVRDRRGTPGVWFYSLDANNWLAVQIARHWYRLPYHYARMEASHEEQTGWIRYRCRRRGADRPARFVYRSTSETIPADPGSLTFFLVERYVLFAKRSGGRLLRARVQHDPYPLEDVLLRRWDDLPLRWNGFDLPGRAPDHAVYSPGVDVAVHRPREPEPARRPRNQPVTAGRSAGAPPLYPGNST